MELNGISSWCHWCLELLLEFFFPTLYHVLVINLEVRILNQTLNHIYNHAIEVDTTYQELDLTKMNKEDNYQSLRVNAASNDAANDHDSTYTELSKTRDVENNYQSLT